MPYILIAPAIVLCVMFRLAPLLMVAGLSFFETDFITTTFVGLGNYRDFFTNPELYTPVINTFLYPLFIVPGVVLISFYIAASAQFFKKAGQHLIRLIIYIPSLITGVVLATMYKWVFHYDGVINWIVGKLGGESILFFNDRMSSILPIAAIMIFAGLGLPVLLYMASLQAIPKEHYDVAEIEGASRWQTKRYVMFPAILPTALLVSLLTTMGAMCSWGYIYMLAPYQYAANLQYKIFYEGFMYGRFGIASAMSLISFVMMIGVILAQIRIKKWSF
jgi:ABC-type sugar transport system permease subunit